MDKIINKIKNFIRENYILSLGTTDKIFPYVSPVYYVSEDGINLFFVSRNDSVHSWNIEKNVNIAGCVFEHYKDFHPQNELLSVQFIGEASRVDNKNEAQKWLDLYGAKLIGAKVWYPKVVSVIEKDSEWSLYKINILKAKMLSTSENIKPSIYLVMS